MQSSLTFPALRGTFASMLIRPLHVVIELGPYHQRWMLEFTWRALHEAARRALQEPRLPARALVVVDAEARPHQVPLAFPEADVIVRRTGTPLVKCDPECELPCQAVALMQFGKRVVFRTRTPIELAAILGTARGEPSALTGEDLWLPRGEAFVLSDSLDDDA